MCSSSPTGVCCGCDGVYCWSCPSSSQCTGIKDFCSTIDCPTQFFSDPSIPYQQFTIPNPAPESPQDYVKFTLCGTFSDGCNPPGGGNVCQGPGCCSVCQYWNVGIVNPGNACLGKFASYTQLSSGSIALTYFGGDPIPPPGPPEPGNRETLIIINPGDTNTLENLTFIDSNGHKDPDGNYVSRITANGPISPCFVDGVLHSCEKCLISFGNGTCEWCLDTKSCAMGGAPSCRNTVRNPRFCPAGSCSSFRNCSSCTAKECIWCNYPTAGCTTNTNQQCQYEIQDPRFCPTTNKIGVN